MKNLDLSIGQRSSLLGILGQQQGNLEKLAPYWRLIEKLRLSEEEVSKWEVKQVEQEGKIFITWSPEAKPTPISIEDSDAVALKKLIESWEGFGPSDFTWLQPILDALKA